MGGCECKAAPSNRRERWEAEELQSSGCCSTSLAKHSAKRQDLTSPPPPPFLLPAPQSAASVGNIGAKTQRPHSKRSSSKTRAHQANMPKPDDVNEDIALKSDHEANEIVQLKEQVANLQREVQRLANASDNESRGTTARGGSNAGSSLFSCAMDFDEEPSIEHLSHDSLQSEPCCRPSENISARSTAASHTSSWCVASRDLVEERQDSFELQSSKSLRYRVRKPTPFALDSPRSDTNDAVES